jgi:hypothetical protein
MLCFSDSVVSCQQAVRLARPRSHNCRVAICNLNLNFSCRQATRVHSVLARQSVKPSHAHQYAQQEVLSQACCRHDTSVFLLHAATGIAYLNK